MNVAGELPGASETSEDLPRMSLMDHLEELRRRIVRSLLVIGVAFGVCWYFAERIFEFLALPIYRQLPEGESLTVLGVPDAFVLYVKVAGLAAIFVVMPWLLGELWGFVSPGLYRRERLWAFPFVIVGWGFFLSGGAFAYFVAFPFAVEFLLGMSGAFKLDITVERYFGFLIKVVLGLGLMFELPIVIFVLSQAGVVSPRFLLRHFRWAVLIIFVLAALLTPTPDVVNLCLFALPTIALYLLGVGAAALAGGWRRKEEPPPEE